MHQKSDILIIFKAAQCFNSNSCKPNHIIYILAHYAANITRWLAAMALLLFRTHAIVYLQYFVPLNTHIFAPWHLKSAPPTRCSMLCHAFALSRCLSASPQHHHDKCLRFLILACFHRVFCCAGTFLCYRDVHSGLTRRDVSSHDCPVQLSYLHLVALSPWRPVTWLLRLLVLSRSQAARRSQCLLVALLRTHAFMSTHKVMFPDTPHIFLIIISLARQFINFSFLHSILQWLDTNQRSLWLWRALLYATVECWNTYQIVLAFACKKMTSF